MSITKAIKRMADNRINRTGIQASPADSAKTIEAAQNATPTSAGDGIGLARIRRQYAEEAEPLGTMPPPATVKGAIKSAAAALGGNRALFLLDKIAERMAFERTGVRLYDELLVAFDVHGSFPGGPTRDELERIQREEAEHFALLKRAMEDMGGDPTAMTPSADLTAVESMGLMQALAEPRRTLGEALHTILIAELADTDGWELLIELCEEAKQQELAESGKRALIHEAEHLALVRSWIRAHARSAARAGGVDAPGANIIP
jgi:rubrerythrin